MLTIFYILCYHLLAARDTIKIDVVEITLKLITCFESKSTGNITATDAHDVESR